MLPKDTFDKLKAEVEMCLVRIAASCEGKPTLFAPGIVIAKNKRSCYIITDQMTFNYGSEGLYGVVFFGSKRELVGFDFTAVSIADGFASFMLNKPKGINPLAAVKIKESDPLIDEDVYTLGYQSPHVSTTHLTLGLVRFVGEAEFVHNCKIAVGGAYGSLVFTVHGALVGINFNNRGAVRAYKVQSIKQHVQKIESQIKIKAKEMLQDFMDQKNVLLEKRKPPVDSSAGASKKSKTTR